MLTVLKEQTENSASQLDTRAVARYNQIPKRRFFFARARCLSAGLRYLRLTRLPRDDRGPVPGGIDPRLAVHARS